MQVVRRTQTRHHDRHQAHRRSDPRPDGDGLPDAPAVDETARPRTTPASRRRAPNRLPCTDVVRPADPAAGFDPNDDPATARLQRVRHRHVDPGHAEARAPPATATAPLANELYLTCGNSARADALELPRGDSSTSRSRPSRASSCDARSRRRRAARSTRAASSSRPSGDGDYQAILNWAKRRHGPTDDHRHRADDPNFMFFAHRVQPMLVKKGCMMLQCHSAAMFHDYRLRGGSGGSFSLAASQKNYELSLAQLGARQRRRQREPHRPEEPLSPRSVDAERRRHRAPRRPAPRRLRARHGSVRHALRRRKHATTTTTTTIDTIPAYCMIPRVAQTRARDAPRQVQRRAVTCRRSARSSTSSAPTRAGADQRATTSTSYSRRRASSTSLAATLDATG